MALIETLAEGLIVSFLYDWLQLRNEEEKRKLAHILKKAAEETATICLK